MASRIHRSRLAFVAACAVLVLPVTASAQKPTPPGNSEIDQYTETLPTPTGNQTIDPGDRGGDGATTGSGGTSVLGDQVAEELEEFGRDGAAAARLARSTAPDRGRKSEKLASPTIDDAPSGVVAVAETLGGSDGEGLGLALPLILAAVAAAGVAVVALRRARQHT